jgi:hypothetical protein
MPKLASNRGRIGVSDYQIEWPGNVSRTGKRGGERGGMGGL